MEIPRLEKSSSSLEVAQALKEAGCVVIERLVPEELMRQIGSELRPFIHSTPFGPDSFTGKKTKRTGSLNQFFEGFLDFSSARQESRKERDQLFFVMLSVGDKGHHPLEPA